MAEENQKVPWSLQSLFDLQNQQGKAQGSPTGSYIPTGVPPWRFGGQ